MSRLTWAHILIVLLLAVYVSLLILQVGGKQGRTILTDVAPVLAALLSVIMALAVWRSYSPAEAARRVWLALAIGIFLLMIGEILWAYYELIVGEELPVLSAGGLFWLVGYLPFIVACWWQYRLLGVPLRRHWFLIALGIFLFLLAAYDYLVLIPMLSSFKYERSIELFMDIAYPVVTLLLILITLTIMLPVIMLFGEGLLGWPWRYILASLLTAAVANMLHSYLFWNKIYYQPSGITLSYIADIFYPAGYLLFTLGTFIQREILIHPLE
jgi:hypothetical protein